MWRGYHATCVELKPIIFNFVLSVNKTRDLLDFVRWNDEYDTAHDPLRIRTTNLSLPNCTPLSM
jgi:hypothetical protein